MRVGIISNEFFDVSQGRMGGFGWAAKRASEVLQAAGHEVLFLSGEMREPAGPAQVHGSPLIASTGSTVSTIRRVSEARCDVFLSIDYRPNYDPFLWASVRSPLVVWVRDPRPPDDLARLETLAIPGQTERPQGLSRIDCTGLNKFVAAGKVLGRKLWFASPAPHTLGPKVAPTYGVRPIHPTLLPNPIEHPDGPIEKPSEPIVAFLGRLDPYKRPWLFAEIARRIPHARFLAAGRAHFSGPGAWTPVDLPPNLEMLGHVDGVEKDRLLRSASLLVNTSIHEGLAVSFLEALAYEVPIVASLDPERVVSRFGRPVEMSLGTGMDAVPSFVESISVLLEERDERLRLGTEGRAWVRATHARDHFLRAFEEMTSGR
jgi:glycosyltransferase involved in cell wall biosynthesis